MTDRDPPPSMTSLHARATGLFALLLFSCGATGGDGGDEAGILVAAPPVVGIQSAYASAGRIRLPDLAPREAPGLPNVFRLSESVISGGQPRDEAAFRELARWGVRTIVSVDGKVPDAAAAAAHGIETVHLPVRYHGLTSEQVLRLVKTFREGRAPFYVHCFHGRHRGPAASAVARLVIDGASREQVVAEMRQWCGTSGVYEGLYRSLLSVPIPPRAVADAFEYDFPSACLPQGLRGAMTEIARVFDALDLLDARDWEPDPDHPDLDALNEARRLAQLFEVCADSESSAGGPQDLRRRIDDALQASRDLERFLLGLRDGQAGAREGAEDAFKAIALNCASCHQPYRNR